MSRPSLNSRSKLRGAFFCACLLAASSADAAVARWDLNFTGTSSEAGVIKAFSESFAFKTLGSQNADGHTQVLIEAGRENGTNATTEFTAALGNAAQPGETNVPDTMSTSFKASVQRSATGMQSDESLFRAESNAPSRPTTELDEAMSRTTFNDDFVSVPSVQFASLASGAMALSAVSSASNVGVVPVPEMSSFFPIIGLVVMVLLIEILRPRPVTQPIRFRRLV